VSTGSLLLLVEWYRSDLLQFKRDACASPREHFEARRFRVAAIPRLRRGNWLSLSSVESFRKEVIQPQVLLQLPCYDFTPITDHTVGVCPPYGSAQRLLVQPAFVM
jgi:hypothetical protein